ncbi:hypothetical protein [Novipirellula rosea]|uniref:Uncharacterized protein n=1 Tax=Novipirellula rosea TaxID=1031540 RepID=A0ABP8NKX6_9BACT
MRYRLRLASYFVLLTAGVLFVIVLTAPYDYQHASNSLRQASSFEVLSLSPEPSGSEQGDHFYRWPVLGSTRVSNASVRQSLMDALDAGVAENDGQISACFSPRHGIRAIVDGRRYELVICFECLHAHWYIDGKQQRGFMLTSSPQPAFDQVLIDSSVPLPKPSEN